MQLIKLRLQPVSQNPYQHQLGHLYDNKASI